MNTKPMPKSLHTVTVLVRMARLIQGLQRPATIELEDALDAALICLGHHRAPDPYGLRAAALKQLEAGK